MLIDYHTHHIRCGHAAGELEEYVKAAIAKGYDEIGLSDHMPLFHVDLNTYLPGSAMAIEEFPRYVEECFMLKQKYTELIQIKVGVEADYILGYEAEIKQILEPYSFDYIIGSVHFLGEWDHSDARQLEEWKKRNVNEVYREYYHSVQQAVQSGIYDIVGHFDVIKRFGHYPTEDMTEIIHETLHLVKKHDMVLELNASGLRHVAKEMFPSQPILELCRELGIPLTLGSDAHKPDHVGHNLDRARQLLQEIGFTELATFTDRKRKLVPINMK